MKSAAILLIAAAAAFAGAGDVDPAAVQRPAVTAVHRVYLFGMTNGLDQYLASRLTKQGVVEVVADPASADAVLTDRLGDAFELRMNKLFPQASPDAEDEDQASRDEKSQENSAPVSSFRRSKGTIFLVDAKTRSVVWSIYRRPKSSSADDMDRMARYIAGDLHQAIKHGLKQNAVKQTAEKPKSQPAAQ